MLPSAPSSFTSASRARCVFGILAPFYDGFVRLVSSKVRNCLGDQLAITAGHDIATLWDVGCGTGLNATFLSARFPRAEYVGIDASSAMLDRAPSLPTARWICSDALTWMKRQPDATADVMLSTFCVDAWPEAEQHAFVAQTYRSLLPGGVIGLITVAEPHTWVERMWTCAGRLSPLVLGGSRPTNLNQLLADAGFTLLHTARVSQFGVASRLTVARRP